MKMIGRYRVCGQLGHGGMGRVYQVSAPVTGKLVALKLLDPDDLLVSLLGGMAAAERLFIEEAVMIANLRHPNILDIWDVDRDGDRLFYVMDYYCHNLGELMGETFRMETPSRRLPPETAVAYARQTLLGLDRLHHAGIIHRDIKPFNLLITDEDGIRICDFGLSRVRGERFAGPPQLKVGTPGYAAPEQESDPDNAVPASDLYAVGVTLYRMLTGRMPDPDVPSPGRFRPELGSVWDRLCANALARDLQNRYQQAEAMIADLDESLSRWKDHMAGVCHLPEMQESAQGDELSEFRPSDPLTLRRIPIRIRPAEARHRFPVNELFQPDPPVANRLIDRGDGTIFDRATGLLWEKSGSRYPVSWYETAQYFDRLNDLEEITPDQAAPGGRRNWRLPTVDELLSLVADPRDPNSLCISPIFDPVQRTLWSADRRSFIAAWYVNLGLGFAGHMEMAGYAYIRGVSDDGQPATA